MEDYSKLRISGDWVGILGLKGAIEEARAKDLTGENLRGFLMEKVRERTYIPSGMEDSYREALYREYCRSMGIPFQEEGDEELSIQILGPGCANCDRLEKEVLTVLSELGTPADIRHIRDIQEIASFGVMGTPALVINGKVRSVGKIPGRDQIRKWIQAMP